MLKPAANAAAVFGRFLKAEGGAVTVEWVAIAAAVVVGAVGITYAVLDKLDPVAAQVGTSLATASGRDGGVGPSAAGGNGVAASSSSGGSSSAGSAGTGGGTTPSAGAATSTNGS